MREKDEPGYLTDERIKKGFAAFVSLWEIFSLPKMIHYMDFYFFSSYHKTLYLFQYPKETPKPTTWVQLLLPLRLQIRRMTGYFPSMYCGALH